MLMDWWRGTTSPDGQHHWHPAPQNTRELRPPVDACCYGGHESYRPVLILPAQSSCGAYARLMGPAPRR